jgi:crotonobetainyl-CoA:carnitine CoA-transferase CaiB-like acyl-CoA transferase
MVEMPHAEVGRKTHVGMPWTIAGAPRRVSSAAPLRGADTDAILTGLLGYSREQIEELRKAGALT